jgi:hypothetical protein
MINRKMMKKPPPPVVVEDLGEHPRVPVEEVLVEDGVVVGQSFSQPAEPGGGNLLQSGLVGLIADAANVQNDAVFPIHNTIASSVDARGDSHCSILLKKDDHSDTDSPGSGRPAEIFKD